MDFVLGVEPLSADTVKINGNAGTFYPLMVWVLIIVRYNGEKIK